MTYDYNGDWKNQLGATMSLSVESDSSVTGWYKTPAAPEKAPLSGYVKNDILVFSVTFSSSAGTMLCQPANNDDDFDTWWHFRLFDDTGPSWASVRTGCDTFSHVK